jgi:uncharacterized RDD family membrane protein YckC
MTFYKYAGFWRRFVAYMIDGVIISIIFIVLAFGAGVAFFAGTLSSGSNVWMAEIADPEKMTSLSLWLWMLSTFINIFYFTYFYGSTGRTPGKMLLGLQVVSIEGGPVSYGTAFLRSASYLVSSLFFCLGFLWIGFDARKQGWHDKIAGTVVIMKGNMDQGAGISIQDTIAVSGEAQPVKRPEERINETGESTLP